MSEGSWSAFLLAGALGASVGLSELLSRYKWTLSSIIRSSSGWAYLAINGGVAAVAYRAALDFGVGDALIGKPEYWRVILVAVGAMFFLRSSLANVRFGNHDVAVGLVFILQVFSGRAERRLDQVVTNRRWKAVDGACEKLTFRATRSHLVAVSETALSSQAEPERAAFRTAIGKIDEMPADDATRMRLLAMLLLDTLGQQLFDTVVGDASSRLQTEIAGDRVSREQRVTDLAKLKVALKPTGEV